MERSSRRLNRQPSFSYPAAEPDQHDPSHMLGLVESALDNAPQAPKAADTEVKVLYQKLDQDGRPYLTTNPNSKKQKWTERNSEQLGSQRKAATMQAFKLGQFWFNNSKTDSDTQHAARALFELANDDGVRTDGLPCTDQLRGLLTTLNEAHKARETHPPQQASPHTPRVSRFQLPSLSLSPRKPKSSPSTTSADGPKHHEVDLSEKSSSGRPASHQRLPSTPRHQTTASRESETEASTSSKRDDSPTKGSPIKLRSAKHDRRLQKQKGMRNVHEAYPQANEVLDLQAFLQDLHVSSVSSPRPRAPQPPLAPSEDSPKRSATAISPGLPTSHSSQDISETSGLSLDLPLQTVAEEDPPNDAPSEEPSPKTPASDRPMPTEKAQSADDAPARAQPKSAIALKPQPRPSILRKREFPATPMPAQSPSPTPQEQAPRTEKH